MNKQHKCRKFTSEAENDNSFSFLDIKITHHNQQFKHLFIENQLLVVYLCNLKVILDQLYKKSLIDTRLFRCFLVCFDHNLFHLEV